MRKHQSWIVALFFAVSVLTPTMLQAQVPPPVALYSSQQLDQLVAPIALYPDQLVSEILMASTYPLEVVEAYRWRQSPPIANLQSNDLADAAQEQPWDPSVKSLTAFPQILKTMNNNLQWTEQLGDAFLAQQDIVMDSVQRLRQRAVTTGALVTTSQQVVEAQGPEIIIEPANPEVIYVPVYNPRVVYGPWPYAGYPPYYFPDSPYVSAGVVIGFGVGLVVVDSLWGWNHWDWNHHRIYVDQHRFAQLDGGHGRGFGSGIWQHDPDHRRGIPYRDATTRARFQGAASPEAHRRYRGYGDAAPQPSAARNAGVYHPMANPVATHAQPVVSPQAAAPQMQHRTVQPMQHPTAQMQVPHSSPVFESFDHGQNIRTQSVRGAASRATMPSERMPVPQQGMRGQGSHGGEPQAHGPQGHGRDDNPNDRQH